MKNKKNVIQISIFFLGVSYIVCRIFLVDYMIISGNSMSVAYKDKDVILICKQYHDISRFDVVIANTKEHGLKGKVIKRVIGLPNEKIQIIGGYVYINDKILSDDIVNICMDYAGIADKEIVLGDDEYFLLGDNRNASEDSRYDWLGIVKEKQIIGKPFLKIVSHKN